MSEITRQSVLDFMKKEYNDNKNEYDDCGNIDCTSLAECAQGHFDVLTDDGQSDIEENIFEWAVDFEVNRLYL